MVKTKKGFAFMDFYGMYNHKFGYFIVWNCFLSIDLTWDVYMRCIKNLMKFCMARACAGHTKV